MIDLRTGAISFANGMTISHRMGQDQLANSGFLAQSKDATANPEYPAFYFERVGFLDKDFALTVYFHLGLVNRIELRWLDGISVKKGYACSREDAMRERDELRKWLESALSVETDSHDLVSDLYERDWGVFGVFVNVRFENECYLYLEYAE